MHDPLFDEPIHQPPHSSDTGDSSDRQTSLQQFPEGLYALLPQVLKTATTEVDEGPRRDAFLAATLPVCAAALPNVQVAYNNGSFLNLYTLISAPSGAGKGCITRTRDLGKAIAQQTNAAQTKSPFFLPANTSVTALIQGLEKNPHGVVHETELKTLNTSLSGGNGNGREVLRKGYHAETVSRNTSSRRSLMVRDPAPSLVLTGTPQQVADLFSTDNGLFSRMSVYRFDVKPEWRSQVGFGSGTGASPLDDLVDTMAEARSQLLRRSESLPVVFANGAQTVLDEAHEDVYDQWQASDVSIGFPSCLHRSGLRVARMATVLRLLEVAHSGTDLESTTNVQLTKRSVRAGTLLALTHLLHSVQLGQNLDLGTLLKSRAPLEKISALQRKFYRELHDMSIPIDLATQIGGDKLGLREAKIRRWLDEFVDIGLLVKWSKDVYRKPRGHSSSPPDEAVREVLEKVQDGAF